jgi:hypothetical protein
MVLFLSQSAVGNANGPLIFFGLRTFPQPPVPSP